MKRTCPICQKIYNSRKLIDDIIKDFPRDKKKWIEMECPDNNIHFKILREREMAKLSRETKQKVLDLLFQGKNVGDIGKNLKLDTMLVAEIIIQNTETYSCLKRKIDS